jgi:hypothetical protein
MGRQQVASIPLAEAEVEPVGRTVIALGAAVRYGEDCFRPTFPG